MQDAKREFYLYVLKFNYTIKVYGLFRNKVYRFADDVTIVLNNQKYL